MRWQRADWLWIGVAILAVLLVALPIMTYPMGRDQGMYANIARSILDGGLPYVDMWDIKPPAIYYLYALNIGVFGGGAMAIRVLDLIAVPLGMLAVYWLGKRLSGYAVAGFFSALIYAVFYFTETFASLTQSDSLITVPMAWAVVFALDVVSYERGSRPALIRAFLAGALCALTIWFKHYYALFVLAVVVNHLITRFTDSDIAPLWRRFPLKESLAFALGGLPVGLIPLLYFLSNGVFDEILIVAEGTARYNAQSAQSFESFVSQLGGYVVFRWQHWGVMLVLALSWLIAPKIKRAEWHIVWLWIVAGLGFVLIQAKGFDTHWIPLLPPLALLAGSALAGWLMAISERFNNTQRMLTILGTVATVLLLAIVAKDTWVRGWSYITGTETRAQYWQNFQGNDFKPWESDRLIRYLDKRTQDGQTLYVWGFRPEVAYLTNLRPATRFQAHFPLVGDYYPEEWKQENVETLWATMPPYVLVMQADWMPWVTGSNDDSAVLLTQYKDLEDWLIFNYERVREFGDFIVWQHKDYQPQ